MSEAALPGPKRRGLSRKKRRLYLLLACGIGLGSAVGLMAMAFQSSIELFVTPSDIAKAPGNGRLFRIGGLVEAGSLTKTSIDGRPTAQFRVTDGHASVGVSYTGILPDLFREGQGVVALGKLAPDGSFEAQEVLAKHDETYMPKDVADALKARGEWNPATGKPPAADTWIDPAAKPKGG